MPPQTQRSASGESFDGHSFLSFKLLLLVKPLGDRLFSFQVAEAVCSVQVGGSSSARAEDGDRAGKDEVHPTTLQVFRLKQTLVTLHITHPVTHDSCFSSGRFVTLISITMRVFESLLLIELRCIPSQPDWSPRT